MFFFTEQKEKKGVSEHKMVCCFFLASFDTIETIVKTEGLNEDKARFQISDLQGKAIAFYYRLRKTKSFVMTVRTFTKFEKRY